MIVGIALFILSIVDMLTIWRIKELEVRIEELEKQVGDMKINFK